MILKDLLKREYNKKKLNSKFKDIALKVITGLLWILFIVYIMWILIIFIWVILSRYYNDYLYIPNGINFIIKTFSYMSKWIVLVSVGFYIIYRCSKYKNRNTEDVESEALHNFNNELLKEKFMYYKLKNKYEHISIEKILNNQVLNQISPYKMFSYGIHLYSKGMIKESMSILRLVIDDPYSSPLIVEVAEYRLMQMLSNID